MCVVTFGSVCGDCAATCSGLYLQDKNPASFQGRIFHLNKSIHILIKRKDGEAVQTISASSSGPASLPLLHFNLNSSLSKQVSKINPELLIVH